MEIYCGNYGSIHYVIEIGWQNIYIRYGDEEVKVKAITDENSDVMWKLNRKSIKFRSPRELFELFAKDKAYANATFSHFCL